MSSLPASTEISLATAFSEIIVTIYSKNEVTLFRYLVKVMQICINTFLDAPVKIITSVSKPQQQKVFILSAEMYTAMFQLCVLRI